MMSLEVLADASLICQHLEGDNVDVEDLDTWGQRVS